MKRVICLEFNNFITDNDNIVDSEDHLLDDIEDRFYPDDNGCTNLISDDDDEYHEASGIHY